MLFPFLYFQSRGRYVVIVCVPKSGASALMCKS